MVHCQVKMIKILPTRKYTNLKTDLKFKGDFQRRLETDSFILLDGKDRTKYSKSLSYIYLIYVRRFKMVFLESVRRTYRPRQIL